MLAEAELNFEKALKIAQAIETANKDVLDLHCKNKMSADVHVKQSTQTVLKFEARNKSLIKSRALTATDVVVITNIRSVFSARAVPQVWLDRAY